MINYSSRSGFYVHGYFHDHPTLFLLTISDAEVREFIFIAALPTSIPGPERKPAEPHPFISQGKEGAHLPILLEDNERAGGLDTCQGPNKAFLSSKIFEFFPFLDFWSFYFFKRNESLAMLSSLAPNTWVQAILLLQPPKYLRL